MSLTDLPEEVIIIIVKKLDLRSLNSLYESSDHFKKILSLPGVIKKWRMCLNTMATAQSLKLNFFKDVAGHLHEVNMSGVADVCKTTIMPALRRLKNLKFLDVSYTDIDVLDFFDMYDACPTIKNICINFTFKKPFKLPENMILRGQKIFEKMDNVHFVGTTPNLLFSYIPTFMLQGASLNKLKFSVVSRKTCTPIECQGEYHGTILFKQMHIYVMNFEVNYAFLSETSILNKLCSSQYEFIIISLPDRARLDRFTVYVTPSFSDFFRNKFGIAAVDFSEFNGCLSGNMSIMIYNKEFYTCFDDNFFKKLFNRLKDCFPVIFDTESEIPATNIFSWFYTNRALGKRPKTDSNGVAFKKKRLVVPSTLLDYDGVFKNKTKINLVLALAVSHSTVTLATSCEYLSKLTYLSLSGIARYSLDFYNVLFRCCCHLETLNVEASIYTCASQVARNVPLSKTLKHLRIMDMQIDFNTFFQSLSQCKTLEIIHLMDRSTENNNLADPSVLFKNCDNLYGICIKACLSNETYKKMSRIFNNAKTSLKKYGLKINLFQFTRADTREGWLDYEYQPYIDVFNVFPIKHGFPL